MEVSALETKLISTSSFTTIITQDDLPVSRTEGRKAFRRLQEEIIKFSTDHSFLAHGSSGLGIFADRPFDFRGSGSIDACSRVTPMQSFSMTNRGLRITLPVVQDFILSGGVKREGLVVALNCRLGGEAVVLRLAQTIRSQSDHHLPIEYNIVSGFADKTVKNLKPNAKQRTIVIVR